MPDLDEDQAAALVVPWGTQLDLRPTTATGPGELSAEAVTGYIAKYATKSTESLGATLNRRINDPVELSRAYCLAINAVVRRIRLVIDVTSRRCQGPPTDRFTAPGVSATMAPSSHPPPSGSGRHHRRQEDTLMDPGTPTILIVAMIAGPFLLILGLSWLFNGRWPWRRPLNGSDEIDRERFRGPGPFLGGGGGDGGGGGS